MYTFIQGWTNQPSKINNMPQKLVKLTLVVGMICILIQFAASLSSTNESTGTINASAQHAIREPKTSTLNIQ